MVRKMRPNNGACYIITDLTDPAIRLECTDITNRSDDSPSVRDSFISSVFLIWSCYDFISSACSQICVFCSLDDVYGLGFGNLFSLLGLLNLGQSCQTQIGVAVCKSSFGAVGIDVRPQLDNVHTVKRKVAQVSGKLADSENTVLILIPHILIIFANVPPTALVKMITSSSIFNVKLDGVKGEQA
nr:hypothetical protein Iba_chr07cCG13570 [Ipomoea batatas]